MRQKIYFRQNIVGLERQIYASQENFTHPLVMTVETLRRSVLTMMISLLLSLGETREYFNIVSK